MSWLNPPPVIVVTGDEDYLRRRELQKALAGAARTGRRVEYIQGTDSQTLSRVLSSGSVLFKDRTLAMVSDADRVDVDMVLRHHKRGSAKVALVLTQEGTAKKKGSLVEISKVLSKSLRLHFEKVALWKRDSFAASFVVKEGKALGIRVSEKVATVMVAAAGDDLGVLSFELQKLAALLGSLEFEKPEKERAARPEVEGVHLRQSLSTLTQVGAISVVEALAARNAKRLVRALATMRKTHTSDPTMKACALLAHNVTQWLHAAALISQNAAIEEIGLRLRLHPYVCKTKVLPAAKNWGERNLAGVLTGLAAVERGVRSGHLNSWVELECVLLKAIHHRSASVS